MISNAQNSDGRQQQDLDRLFQLRLQELKNEAQFHKGEPSYDNYHPYSEASANQQNPYAISNAQDDEAARLKRLKLREEERLRRQHGIEDSAFGAAEEALQRPVYEQPVHLPPRAPVALQQQQQPVEMTEFRQTKMGFFNQKKPSSSSQQQEEVAQYFSSEQEEKLEKREKQKKYKEELDLLMQQKNSIQGAPPPKPYSSQQQTRRGSQQPQEQGFLDKFGQNQYQRRPSSQQMAPPQATIERQRSVDRFQGERSPPRSSNANLPPAAYNSPQYASRGSPNSGKKQSENQWQRKQDLADSVLQMMLQKEREQLEVQRKSKELEYQREIQQFREQQHQLSNPQQSSARPPSENLNSQNPYHFTQAAADLSSNNNGQYARYQEVQTPPQYYQQRNQLNAQSISPETQPYYQQYSDNHGTAQYQDNSKEEDIQKKRRFREELDRQVAEKKQLKAQYIGGNNALANSGAQQYREDQESAPQQRHYYNQQQQVAPRGNEFEENRTYQKSDMFSNKNSEDERKARKEQQKRSYAEELKQQMQEKERKKQEEKEQKKLQDMREQQRLEAELQREREEQQGRNNRLKNSQQQSNQPASSKKSNVPPEPKNQPAENIPPEKAIQETTPEVQSQHFSAVVQQEQLLMHNQIAQQSQMRSLLEAGQRENNEILQRYLEQKNQEMVQLMQNRDEMVVYRQIMEERMKIQQIEIECRLQMEQYSKQVKEANSQREDMEREIQKLKVALERKTGHAFDFGQVSQVYLNTLAQSGYQFFQNQNVVFQENQSSIMQALNKIPQYRKEPSYQQLAMRSNAVQQLLLNRNFYQLPQEKQSYLLNEASQQQQSYQHNNTNNVQLVASQFQQQNISPQHIDKRCYEIILHLCNQKMRYQEKSVAQLKNAKNKKNKKSQIIKQKHYKQKKQIKLKIKNKQNQIIKKLSIQIH